MSLIFGTAEWLDAFMKRINEDEEYKRVAVNYEGRIIFLCLAEPGIHPMLNRDLRFYIDPYHGEIREWRVLEPGDDPDVEYEISGAFKNWKLIAEGKLNLKKAVIMTRQIKIKGKISELIKHMKAADRIIRVLAEMRGEFLFPDEAET